MTFLDSLRSRESYLDRIPKDSVGSLAQEKAALSNFDQFCEYKFKVSSDNMLRELRKINGTKQESVIFEMLQNFANFMVEEQHMTISTAKHYVTKIKNHLNYMIEIKIHNEDLRQNVRWSKEEQRDDYPYRLKRQD